MIIIFGAGGFIGTYLTDHLIGAGKEVLACDVDPIVEGYYLEKGVPYQRVDITQAMEFDALPVNGIEAVIHLACVQPANVSQRQYNASDFIHVNALGTLNILEFCRKSQVPKIIYTSSHRNTQGMWAEKAGTPIREKDGRAIKFTGEYAMFSISESAATDCVQHYSEAHGIEGVVLRLPPVYGYGPHMEIFREGKPQKTGFQIFIDNAEQGRPLEIWGDPENGRDIVYVKDVVAAFELSLQKSGVSGLYNISSGRRISLKEQAETIIRVFCPPGSPSEIRYRPEIPNLIENYVYDIERASQVLGWRPNYSFQEMLVDYSVEVRSRRFEFLIKKRMALMQLAADPV